MAFKSLGRVSGPLLPQAVVNKLMTAIVSSVRIVVFPMSGAAPAQALTPLFNVIFYHYSGECRANPSIKPIKILPV